MYIFLQIHRGKNCNASHVINYQTTNWYENQLRPFRELKEYSTSWYLCKHHVKLYDSNSLTSNNLLNLSFWFVLLLFVYFVLLCFFFCFFFAVINIPNAERKKDQKKKVLLGKGTKGNVFFERSTNTWAFFCDGLPRIVFGFSVESEQLHIHFLKSWQFCTHTRCTCISSFSRFPFVGQIQPTPTSINFPFSFRLRFSKLTSQTISLWQPNNDKAKYFG